MSARRTPARPPSRPPGRRPPVRPATGQAGPTDPPDASLPEPPADQTASIGTLVADPSNRRLHNPRNIEIIGASLKAVGTARSIVIDEDNIILAGNGVTEAARTAGVVNVRIIETDGDELIAVRRRGLTAEQKRLLAMYDNRTAELATWNVDQLQADALAGLDLKPFFFPDELAMLLGSEVKGGRTDPDAVPEVRATDIQRGDLFELGAHRLLCGDCTDADDVARVMGGRASIVLTSPPYGAGNVAKLRDHYVKGRASRQSFYSSHDDAPRDWPSLMASWYRVIRPFVEAVIVNVQLLADNKRPLIEWLYANREDFCDVIVWDKINAAPQMQANVLSNAFEFLFVFGWNGSRAMPFADFHGSLQNVVRIDPRGKNDLADVHRAVMPVALPVWVLCQLCPQATTIAEPFIGTGTTLIACEQLSRRCIGIDIEPQYCQVTIDRWEAFTGQTAVKVGEAVRT